MLLVLIGLRRPGTSKDLKLKVFKRYFSYLIVFILWVISSIKSLDESFDEYLMIISALLGVPLALARLFEPLVWQEFK